MTPINNNQQEQEQEQEQLREVLTECVKGMELEDSVNGSMLFDKLKKIQKTEEVDFLFKTSKLDNIINNKNKLIKKKISKTNNQYNKTRPFEGIKALEQRIKSLDEKGGNSVAKFKMQKQLLAMKKNADKRFNDLPSLKKTVSDKTLIENDVYKEDIDSWENLQTTMVNETNVDEINNVNYINSKGFSFTSKSVKSFIDKQPLDMQSTLMTQSLFNKLVESHAEGYADTKYDPVKGLISNDIKYTAETRHN